jgi:hypothetical protein
MDGMLGPVPRSPMRAALMSAVLLPLGNPARAADTWTAVAPGIDRLHRTAAGPLVAHAVSIDLSRDEVQLRTTRAEEAGRTTSSFASLVGARVAINGDWFSSGAQPAGVAMGEGAAWGAADTDTHAFFACTLYKDCWIDEAGHAASPGVRWWSAVGGNNALLVVDGAALAHGGSFYESDRHPRSAVGLSQDGQTLLLVVVDGRSTSSIGSTWNDMAALMANLGAHEAMMLDGGGSSTLVVDGGAVNTPSDGGQRSVANHIGVLWDDSPEAGCEDAPNGRMCLDETNIASCVSGVYSSGDCATYGATCEEDPLEDFAYCVDWRCGGDGSAAYCGDGEEISVCEDGVYASGDCAAYGLSCVEGLGSAWCAAEFYQARLLGTDLPVVDGLIEVPSGESITGELWFENTGLDTWTPERTRLAPLPRDTAHPLGTGDWLAGNRVSGVRVATPPGGTGTFPITLSAPADEPTTLSLALVEEGVTWFADAPAGGGPAEDALVWTVAHASGGGGQGTGGGGAGGSSGSGGSDGSDGDVDAPDETKGDRSGGGSGGCTTAPSGAAIALCLLPLAALVRRRRH